MNRLKKQIFGWIIVTIMLLVSAITTAEESVNSAPETKRDYILGAGDLVRIGVYGSPDLLTEARLSAAGSINFALIGEVVLGGLSPQLAEKQIADLLEKGGFVKKPQVNLVVLQFQSQFISVLGDVYKPGKYSLDRPSTLSDVLAMAGGTTPNGSDMITLIRNSDGKTTKQNYDLRDLVNKADPASNPPLLGDDIVYVNAREVSVLGQVNRPGKYSVASGVRTVIDFLSQAGGVSAGGADSIIVITKRDGKTEKREIDIDQLYRKGDTSANFELADGDSIYVPRTSVFYIYGEVQRPGAFRLERNMNIAQALSTGGGLSPRGTERGIKIKRNVDGKLKILDASSGDLLKPDDIVMVRESWF